ncbi:DNA invertase Pin-like site-specific DNA recombinase [Pontibacter ummariensis]|uniref:Site-specific DNA recombinase n=1 Tax=Pontibacter ummariensis TaxID=1610492 RepID=A0A239FUW9_9BACT|nr:recombinase family protein [Pontibacter ummariensis]PRY11907.1 DNA invertase Pin-like site-specific DNA recombinase [Pontibacter ummariensis]SNS60807.1 Site-specific DNA recombinase [Pontibacter ummariensis]
MKKQTRANNFKPAATTGKPAANTGKQDLSIFALPQQTGKKKSKAATRGKVAVIYTRVSTKEQAETNQSLETQLKHCRAYAERHGYEVVETFGGTYESAKSDERKEFKVMLDFVKKSRHNIGHIIVYSHDRFSRSGSSAIHIIDQLSQLGISVVAVTQPMDTMTSSGKLQQGIHLLFSQFDNDQRREKCVTGMEAKIRKGYLMGKAPIGYDQYKVNGEQVIKPNKTTGKLIRLAFQLKAEQGLSNTDIIKRLKAQGLSLYNQTLTKIFRNPFYCGLITHGLLEEGEVIEGRHEPLISRDLFLRVNGLQAQNAHGYTQVKEDEHLPLRHHIKCGSCNKPLTGYEMKKKGIHYYKCNTKGCCLNRNAGKMHELYQGLLKEYQIDPILLPQVQEMMGQVFKRLSQDHEQEEKRLKLQLTELKKKLDTLERRYAYGEIDREIFSKFSAELKAEMREIEVNLEKLSGPLSNHKMLLENGLKMMLNLSSSWGKADASKRRRLQALVFPEGVQYDREKEAYRTQRVNSFFGLASEISQKMGQKERGKSSGETDFSLLVARRGIEL